METLEIAYMILYNLEHKRGITPAVLGADLLRWGDVVQSLSDEGYVLGVLRRVNVLGETEIDVSDARITLKGAQYLKENSMMAKIAAALGHVIPVVSKLS